jgi:hypothetical protein
MARGDPSSRGPFPTRARLFVLQSVDNPTPHGQKDYLCSSASICGSISPHSVIMVCPETKGVVQCASCLAVGGVVFPSGLEGMKPCPKIVQRHQFAPGCMKSRV